GQCTAALRECLVHPATEVSALETHVLANVQVGIATHVVHEARCKSAPQCAIHGTRANVHRGVFRGAGGRCIGTVAPVIVAVDVEYHEAVPPVAKLVQCNPGSIIEFIVDLQRSPHEPARWSLGPHPKAPTL